jgi:formylglycine-generating enzyme required for sulfatase activity
MKMFSRFKVLAAALVMAAGINCAQLSFELQQGLQQVISLPSQSPPPAQQQQSPAQQESPARQQQPPASAQDLPKIAVYVTGNVGEDEKKALGTRMLTSLVNSGRYIAIERSSSFLAEIDNEHMRQRSGAIDDSQISELGKQFGVKFVCIADITPALGAFQVSARIVDVETAVVAFIGESASALKTLEDLAQVSDQVVKNMFSGQMTFAMKSTPEYTAAGREEPKPSTQNIDIAMVLVEGKEWRKPAIKDFYMSKYEITQKQWVQVMGTNPSKFKGDDLPVEMVSWNDIQGFISKLNTITGKKYRLPTEEEWEYAAIGGNKSNGYKYSGGNSIDNVAWYRKNSKDKTHAIGTKQPNELGIHDMSGNVFEWTNTTDGGFDRVNRGGGWSYDAVDCRVSSRGIIHPGIRRANLGFRLALSQ